MTEDARNSLTALLAVSLFVGGFSLFLWLAEDIDPPAWAPVAGMALGMAGIVIGLLRWRMERRR